MRGNQAVKITMGRYPASFDQVCSICKKNIQSGDEIIVIGDWLEDPNTKQLVFGYYHTEWMHLQCFLDFNQDFLYQLLNHLLYKYLTPETYRNVIREIDLSIMASKIGRK